MLKICCEFCSLDFSELMGVYVEENARSGAVCYPNASLNEQILWTEQDAYSYLLDFFQNSDSFYAIWTLENRYVSALRIERYNDGFLLEALETAPDARNKGYAKHLVKETLAYLSAKFGLPVYSHVAKNNHVSLAVHKACGFVRIKEAASFIDGSVSHNSYTLCYHGH